MKLAQDLLIAVLIGGMVFLGGILLQKYKHYQIPVVLNPSEWTCTEYYIISDEFTNSTKRVCETYKRKK